MVFTAVFKGRGWGEAPFAPLCNFQTPLFEGMESDVSTREAAQFRKKVVFLLRREYSFEVASFTFSWIWWRFYIQTCVCVRHIGLFSGFLPLLQSMIEETKITEGVFFLLYLHPAATGTTLVRQSLASQLPNAP